MTAVPDWLVERAALDEVPPASRGRVDAADPKLLAEQIAALRAANDAELAAHPGAPAIAQIEARVVTESKRRAERRRRLIGMAGMLGAVAAALVLVVVVRRGGIGQGAIDGPVIDDETTRPKGAARLLAFRQTGDHAEPLGNDSIAKPGDIIQLRYNAGGHRHGVIASIDGAGEVTLHYPAEERGSTSLATKPTALPSAYQLDDAPSFERFFFLTADAPLDVIHTLHALRALARRSDSATAPAELPAGVHQWSLRLIKKADTQ